jgi:hypothetical protein
MKETKSSTRRRLQRFVRRLCQLLYPRRQRLKVSLRLAILRLQIRNAVLVCFVGLLKLRNSITEFRYCLLVFIHNLMLGYQVDDREPPNVQSSSTRDQMT